MFTCAGPKFDTRTSIHTRYQVLEFSLIQMQCATAQPAPAAGDCPHPFTCSLVQQHQFLLRSAGQEAVPRGRTSWTRWPPCWLEQCWCSAASGHSSPAGSFTQPRSNFPCTTSALHWELRSEAVVPVAVSQLGWQRQQV